MMNMLIAYFIILICNGNNVDNITIIVRSPNTQW